MEKLKDIAKLLHTQDNRITEQPIFIVQQKVRHWGYDSQYSDNYAWCDTDNEYIEADEEEALRLDEVEFMCGDTGSWEKIYYNDTWEFVTACFTEQGCKDYLALNGHNLNEPRIYAEGSCRNEEYRRVRKAIMDG